MTVKLARRTPNRVRDTIVDNEHEQSREFELERRVRTINEFWHRYASVVRRTDSGFAGTMGLEGTGAWIRKTKPTLDASNIDSLIYREEFFEGLGGEVIEEGEALKVEFDRKLHEAEPYISEASMKRWIERFKDEKVGFQEKKYWVRRQFPYYILNWKKVMKEYDTLLADPRFNLLGPSDVDVMKIRNRATFLGLHYERRADLLAKARAAILAHESGKSDLYLLAKRILNKAVVDKVMSPRSVGGWLERIFKSGCFRERIEKFLNPESKASIFTLIANWAAVKERYDGIVDKIAQRGRSAARGLYVVSLGDFLSMHYIQRLRYVEETERRIEDANDVRNELPIFLSIRHSLDTRDWEGAAEEIAVAELRELSSEQRERLESMKRYLTQMSGRRALSSKKNNAEAVREAKTTIDEIVQGTPVNLLPMLLRLLRSPHANRNIHQFRWIIYNNKWCRDHHYLNREKMLIGASEENEERTYRLANQDEDVGLNDVLSEQNADQKFIRKEEYANHKPTLLHVDVNSCATMTLAGWLEKEQDPNVLYWMTFCGNEDGDPQSDEWHDDRFFELTELRAATRVLEQAGYIYRSPAQSLVPFVQGTPGAPPVILN